MVLLRNQDDSKKDTLGDIVSSGGMAGRAAVAAYFFRNVPSARTPVPQRQQAAFREPETARLQFAGEG